MPSACIHTYSLPGKCSPKRNDVSNHTAWKLLPDAVMLNQYFCYLSESVFCLVASFRRHLARFVGHTGIWSSSRRSHDLIGLATRPDEAGEMPAKARHQAKYRLRKVTKILMSNLVDSYRWNAGSMHKDNNQTSDRSVKIWYVNLLQILQRLCTWYLTKGVLLPVCDYAALNAAMHLNEKKKEEGDVGSSRVIK